MSGVSETAAVMTSREPFTLNPTVSPGQAQNPSASQPQLDQQMRVSYTPDIAYRSVGSPPPYHSMPGGSQQVMNLNSGDQKRRRGRPRKYMPDGNMAAMAMASAQQPINMAMPPQMQTFSPPVPPPLQPLVGGSASPTVKKSRGRPAGSINRKKQMEAIGSTGIGFIPHVIDVKPGEDVSSKIMAFSQNGPRAVCILSANGAISNVTLRQAATSGGTATYEGRFDLLSLSGSFMLSDAGGQKSRTGGLSTTLAGPDGRVFGGCVAGLLIAASSVQCCPLAYYTIGPGITGATIIKGGRNSSLTLTAVPLEAFGPYDQHTPMGVIVGSFIADGQKEPKPTNYMEPLPGKMNLGGATTGASSSPSRGTFSESSGEPASPLNLSSGACNNNHAHAMSAIPWK
ncbi:hypothetical protein OROMI_010569 [Orobanche minor]